MKVGDNVQFFEDRDSTPEDAVVVLLYGSCWARLKAANGDLIDGVFVASNHHQSPNGNYCLPRPTSDGVKS